MDDHSGALDQRRESRGLAHVALHELDAGAPQPAGVLRATNQRAHAAARREKGVGDVAAHGPTAPRDGDEITAHNRRVLSLD